MLFGQIGCHVQIRLITIENHADFVDAQSNDLTFQSDQTCGRNGEKQGVVFSFLKVSI